MMNAGAEAWAPDAARALSLAAAAQQRIAIAESLTGGLLADALVSVPGASRVVSGAIVAYDTALKHELLGVDAEVLRERGPVDGLVAEQMARGVRVACATPRGGGEPTGALVPAEIGLATTGVAGPDPDPQTGQPVGTVWIGLSTGRSDRAREFRFAGDRAQIRRAAVNAAIAMLQEALSGAAADYSRQT